MALAVKLGIRGQKCRMIINCMAKKRTNIIVVKPKMTKRRKQELNGLSVTLRHLPENLSRMRLSCNACGFSFSPEWFKKQNIPLRPVKPIYETKGVPYIGDGRWIPTGTTQICPKCKSLVEIRFPQKGMLTKGSLFGDDAQREYNNRKLFVYSLVGADQSILPILNASVNKLKEKICTSEFPENWRLHMKDLWSGNHRKKHRIFRNLSFDEVKNIIGDLCNIITESKLFVYNIALCIQNGSRKSKGIVNQIRNDAYILLVLYAIDEWTSKNAQPQIYFDAEKESKVDKVIHNWARQLFIGSQHCILYAFLAKGIEIPEPQFVAPASQPGLELADFVSYVIARYHFRKWQEKYIEIDPKDLGLVTYLGYDKHGFCWKRQVGYPMECIL